MHILFIVRFDPFKCSSGTEIFVGKRALKKNGGLNGQFTGKKGKCNYFDL